MTWRIATFAVDHQFYQAIRIRTARNWLFRLTVIFSLIWFGTDDSYFLLIITPLAVATILTAIAVASLTAAIYARLQTDLERRGLTNIQSIGDSLFIADHAEQRVHVELIAESSSRIGVWVRPIPM